VITCAQILPSGKAAHGTEARHASPTPPAPAGNSCLSDSAPPS